MQEADIDQEGFTRAYIEYRAADLALHEQCMLICSLDCPACNGSPHAVHIDGNHKLFNWGHVKGRTRVPITSGVLFFHQEPVMQHLEYLDLAISKQQQVMLCTCLCMAAHCLMHC